jgi:hypothetical protein
MSPKYVSARRPHRDRGEKAPEYPRDVPKQKAKSAAIEKTEFLAVDAVLIGPVSKARFPANREKNREFLNF